MSMPELIELRARLESEFASILAPDLAANDADQVRIVLASETDLQMCGEFTGLTSSRMHRWLREFVPNWSGPGPTMLIADSVIRADCHDDPAEMDARLVGVTVHELGHICCVPGLYQPDGGLPLSVDTDVRQAFRAAVASPAAFHEQPVRADHGHEWLRACCHLVYRMRARGWCGLHMPQVISHEYYSYKPMGEYTRALGDEPARLVNMPLTVALALPTPRQFMKLWARDVLSHV